jgi:hypothetical protein
MHGHTAIARILHVSCSNIPAKSVNCDTLPDDDPSVLSTHILRAWTTGLRCKLASPPALWCATELAGKCFCAHAKFRPGSYQPTGRCGCVDFRTANRLDGALVSLLFLTKIKNGIEVITLEVIVTNTFNPVSARRVDSSFLVVSLSSHRYSSISLLFNSRFIDS